MESIVLLLGNVFSLFSCIVERKTIYKKPIHFRMGLRISEYPKSINFSFSDSRD